MTERTVARCYRDSRMRLPAMQGLLLAVGLFLVAAPPAGAAQPISDPLEHHAPQQRSHVGLIPVRL